MRLQSIIPTLAILAGVTAIQAPAATAAEASTISEQAPAAATDSTTVEAIYVSPTLLTDSPTDAVPVKKRSGFRRHFTWGVDVGASIDLSGEDMSTFDAETYFGYKGSWVRTAALGIGIHKAFGNKYTFIPFYAMVRTSFRSKPSLFFFELKAGYSFNTLSDSGSFGGAYGSLGLGINLAMSKSFQSHIVLSYSYFTLRHATELSIPYSGDNINSAVLKFGINF